VRWQFDMPCPTADISAEFVLTTTDQAVSRSLGNPGGPVHINCMYREPLAPVKTKTSWTSYVKNISSWLKGSSAYTKYVTAKPRVQTADIEAIASNIKKIKSGIIIVGKLLSVGERNSVLKLAEKLNWPVFPDIASGLRLGNKHKNIVPYFDQILLSDKFQGKYKPDGILHLGGRITSKRWYEYIEKTKPARYIMALSHPLRNDPLHNVTTRIQCSVNLLCSALAKQLPKRGVNRFLSSLQKLNGKVHSEVNRFLGRQINICDPQVVCMITELIPSTAGLFLSNSMPIREVDMYGKPNAKAITLGANRGASGIDGIIASAIGFSAGSKKQTTLLIGDLAFLYDINSLAMLRDLERPMVIVVLNNNGGGIFSFLPVKRFCEGFEKFFGTPHHLTFSGAADLFDLNYARPETAEEFAKIYQIALRSQASAIIEINTDRAYNLEIHQKLQNKIKTAVNSALK